MFQGLKKKYKKAISKLPPLNNPLPPLHHASSKGDKNKLRILLEEVPVLGMVSNKLSIVTISGHKHFKQNFISNMNLFTKDSK